ncbi:MAG: 5'-nucleotidase C-terminal domain-containing protein [Myxococcales bacterium]|nr:5'-nucleotidase C-terminal domain-containing protein [Polyangiaceae bacterium]MDW8251647.1 5'-nucleotidase C-terminal domain-containing protein [Myxococcales bacterium]
MVAPSRRGPSLRVVCVNDVYTLENFPRLRTLVLRMAEEDPADLMLVSMAGDFVSPSLLSSLDLGRGMIDCMNAVPFTHAIFGNHEDDLPIDALQERVREFRGTWLSTNLGFDPPLPATQILHLGGSGKRQVRVGLLGVVMHDPTIYRGKPFGGFPLLPANETALCTAARLVEQEGCACVLPFTHQEIAADRALLRAQTNPPFPVLIGGHEHAVFLEQVGSSWLVKAGSDAVHAAVVDLRWPEEAPPPGSFDLPEVKVRLLDVAHFEEDAILRARVDGHMKAVQELEAATLLVLEPGQTLSSVGTRERQTSLGELICSRLRDVMGAEVALFNGGGIRAGRTYERRFTYGDLKAEVPFDNEIVVARLPGAVLREAVDFSRSRGVSGGFLQVDDGVRFDLGAHRIVEVAGAPLDEERKYRVALVRNLFFGMDHLEPLVQFARENPACIPPPGSGREAKMALLDAFARSFWAQLDPFERMDLDQDGSLGREEIAQAVARRTSEPASPITVELLLKAVDTNRDERVSPEEDRAARA